MKLKIVAGVCIVLILAAAVMIIRVKPKPQAPSEAPAKTSTPSTNPLIDSSELQKIRKQMNAPGTPQFKYRLAPDLQSRALPLIGSVDAASRCSATALGNTATVYLLKQHLSRNDAGKLAEQYGFLSAPYGLPEGGVTFQYIYTDDYRSGVYAITEASGVSYYSRASIAGESPRSLTEARGAVTEALHSYKIENLTGETVSPTADGFHFRYTKAWGSLPLVDMNSLKSALTTGVCNIPPATAINTVNVTTKSDNTIAAVADLTRKTDTVANVATISLADSLSQYGDTPLIEPVTATGTAGGTVTIETATVAYFDYGSLYPQTAYAPVYVVAGRIDGTNNSVITIFPAVRMQDIAGLPKTGAATGASHSQSQEFFELDTIPPPPPEVSPLNSADYEMGNAAGQDFTYDADNPDTPYTEEPGACVGRTVGYTVSCQLHGTSVCSGTVFLPESQDTRNLCETGCTGKETMVSNRPGEDACKAYLKTQGIDTGGYTSYGGYSGGTAVTCSFLACPL